MCNWKRVNDMNGKVINNPDVIPMVTIEAYRTIPSCLRIFPLPIENKNLTVKIASYYKNKSCIVNENLPEWEYG